MFLLDAITVCDRNAARPIAPLARFPPFLRLLSRTRLERIRMPTRVLLICALFTAVLCAQTPAPVRSWAEAERLEAAKTGHPIFPRFSVLILRGRFFGVVDHKHVDRRLGRHQL
jgi:hypothetical protein